LVGAFCVLLYATTLYAGYVGCLQAFWTLDYFKINRITFSKGLEAIAVDGREVNEYILATFLLQKTKPLAVIEPLNPALCHTLLLLLHSA